MKYNVFIDGAEGTTGLKIHQYFQKREDIQVLKIEEAKRKDMEARLSTDQSRRTFHSFVCRMQLPREIAEAAPKDCRILDTSTAHRTDPEWVYGMPELCSTQRDKDQRKQSRSRTGMPCDRRDPAHKTASCGWSFTERLSGGGIFPDGLQRRRQEDDRAV